MSSSPESSAGALVGYRVLDLAGPLGVYCTKLLADLGADVVRVEPPSGDPMRALPPHYQAPSGETVSLYYLQMTPSKRAVGLAPTRDAGRALFLRLVEQADILADTWQ